MLFIIAPAMFPDATALATERMGLALSPQAKYFLRLFSETYPLEAILVLLIRNPMPQVFYNVAQMLVVNRLL